MNVPLLDLKRQYNSIKEELDQAVFSVLSHTRFIMGPDVKAFEEKAAEYCGSKFAVGVASGTDALLLSLRACGVGPGDEVITSTFTYFATAGAITRLGATPVFVDIDPDTYNLDPGKIENRITPQTKAIIPVHLYGQCADMDPIMEIAKKHNLKVVEDAAQAIGAKYKGKKAGTMGHFGCFSFFPSKNLGAAGDGGMITTDDEEIAELLRILRVHGAKPKYYHALVGYNSRLDTIQAAILSVKLKYLDEWTEKRREHAQVYNAAFRDSDIITPKEEDFNYHIYHQYTIAVKDRDKLRRVLKEKQIGHEIYYPVPLHLQECYRFLGYKEGDLPVAERKAKEVISLPIYPELTT
ncbi:MAG: aminotransferase class V-fold PLP-dependent enzyme, partial [candidate division Zixibacteria bacterium]|nr:aminotransferase class V-fold PLP-dependent enzyme [candidate division Zixibacteria bacterium]